MSPRSPIRLVVADDEADMRLDLFLCRRIPGISRGSVRRLVTRGQVLVEGRRRVKGVRLGAGQQVLVAAAAYEEQPVPQPELPLDLLAVTPAIVAVNKPPGVHCHPLLPGETETVANALVARHPECAGASVAPGEGGLLHRLDWCTSGVLLAARSRAAYLKLRALFSAEQVVKHYLALVGGVVPGPGAVSLPLLADRVDRRRVRLGRDPDQGMPARSEYAPLITVDRPPLTLVHVTARTGRRHQIRAHLAAIGHPLVGDELYGEIALPGVRGALLHALRVEIAEEVFHAPLPPERHRLLRDLGWSGDHGAR